jgi:hypothetical protein
MAFPRVERSEVPVYGSKEERATRGRVGETTAGFVPEDGGGVEVAISAALSERGLVPIGFDRSHALNEGSDLEY